MSQYDGHDSGGTAGRGEPDDSGDGGQTMATESIPGTGPGRSTETATSTSNPTGSSQSLGTALGLGTVIGLVAFAFNYALMFVYTATDGVNISSAEAPEITLKLVGQILFNAQFVPTKASSGFSALGDSGRTVVEYNYVRGTQTVVSGSESATSSSGEFVTQLGSTVPTVVYHATPVVVLFLSGLVLVSVIGARPNLVAGAVIGGFITLGTLIASVAGVILFRISIFDVFTLAPRLLMGIAVAGIGIPLFAGALGGMVGSALKRAV